MLLSNSSVTKVADSLLLKLKSTLSSLPTYFMSVHTILVLVAKKLQKQRDFLWNGDCEQFTYCLPDGRRSAVRFRMVVIDFSEAFLGSVFEIQSQEG